MKKIAIQGHSTRGKDVIKILESLGGNNYSCLEGKNTNSFYWVSTSNCNIRCNFLSCVPKGYKYYTLEEYEQQFNNMEKRNIQIDLTTAKKWYNQGGDLRQVALQAFFENELNTLPKSWEEYCNINPYIIPFEEHCLNFDDRVISTPIKNYKRIKNSHFIPSEERAKQFLTLNKLLQIRDYYNQGWEPNWIDSDERKYVIVTNKNGLYKSTSWYISFLFAFKTKELRDAFFTNFKTQLESIKEFL